MSNAVRNPMASPHKSHSFIRNRRRANSISSSASSSSSSSSSSAAAAAPSSGTDDVNGMVMRGGGRGNASKWGSSVSSGAGSGGGKGGGGNRNRSWGDSSPDGWHHWGHSSCGRNKSSDNGIHRMRRGVDSPSPPPAPVLSLQALRKLQLDRADSDRGGSAHGGGGSGGGGGGNTSGGSSTGGGERRDGHRRRWRRGDRGRRHGDGSASVTSERSGDGLHSDMSDGGGHLSDTCRSVRSHVSDASHATHFTDAAHSVVSDGHQSAISMDVHPPSSIAGSVTHSPPRSIAGSTYAHSYAGSVAGESVADRESSVDGSEVHPPLSPEPEELDHMHHMHRIHHHRHHRHHLDDDDSDDDDGRGESDDGRSHLHHRLQPQFLDSPPGSPLNRGSPRGSHGGGSCTGGSIASASPAPSL
jgi:hypothetical protein